MRLHIQPRPTGVPQDLGEPELPGSKSHTQRAMLIAGFAPGEWRLQGALRAEDSEVLGQALDALGASCTWGRNGLAVRGRTAGPLDGGVFLGENGTAARSLAALVPLLGGRVRLDGREGLQRRPMDAAIGFLEAHGASVRGRALPMVVDGRRVRWPRELRVDGRTTTQVATGALLGQALRQQRLWLPPARSVVVEAPAARAYLDVTARVLEQMGLRVQAEAAGPDGADARYAIRGRPDQGGDVSIPVDPSTRLFPLVLAGMHGLDPRFLPGAPEGDPHPDWAVEQDLAQLAREGDVELADLAARPDCVPGLAALAATREGTTAFTNIPNLRHKESDRIAAMHRGLAAAGVEVREHADGFVVRGPLPGGNTPVVLPTAPDHRIVMSLALLGTCRRGGVVVEHSTAVRKSWPGFFGWLERVAEVRLVPV